MLCNMYNLLNVYQSNRHLDEGKMTQWVHQAIHLTYMYRYRIRHSFVVIFTCTVQYASLELAYCLGLVGVRRKLLFSYFSHGNLTCQVLHRICFPLANWNFPKKDSKKDFDCQSEKDPATGDRRRPSAASGGTASQQAHSPTADNAHQSKSANCEREEIFKVCVFAYLQQRDHHTFHVRRDSKYVL